MSEKTVLVIDDSTTIRRLCDKELSAHGYRVLVAPTAEEGVETAILDRPDLIILDHQLPGKTGYEVACELLSNPETATIPVVASSTLRKKAYVEYVDCDNVVDMLPKPYTPEALIATIENAIDTGVMVVQSQSDGSSVPEVIDELGESDLTGTFGCFGLREIIDLLNNGSKCGMLTVENESCRVCVYVDRGRIQAVTASGLDPDFVSSKMPESLAELAPVIKFTIAGRRGSEIDGLLGLLDSKVLDPRLLKKLLRLQAAILLRICFTTQVNQFRFDREVSPPHLFKKLPLDSSLLSLLVESALICESGQLPECAASEGYARKAIRGQNLDRAGLSGRHMKLMNLVSEPVSVAQIAKGLGWSEEEAIRVAHGFEMAELIEKVSLDVKTKVFGVIADGEQALKVRSFYQQSPEHVAGKLVRDSAGLKLLLRRTRPDVLLVEVGDESQALLEEFAELLSQVRVVGIHTGEGDATHEKIASMLSGDCTVESIREAVLEGSTSTVEV
ncbi:response regulator [Mariniblastus fucicola]|uniref:Putative transcriptional regulatory protein pdtaR n=1 Tax=Mariniblastus fucicola TaxID=980251 RepID=A0A5B9P6N0_9BACT|nr:response regulator [Mariniblastus fucicola]QEG20662.1 putative transcriptional regulatory protein pdtaR [Mariniblastus fucicola]